MCPLPLRPLLLLLLALALATPLAAQEQHPPGWIPERPGDPHRPNPNPRGGAAPQTIVRRGPWTSIQVNVDAAGNNIPGDAANEPSLAIDPNNPNRIVIGWRQFDTVSSNFRQNGWAYSTNAGQTWTFPGTVQPATFNSDPVLDFTAAGELFYLSYPGTTTFNFFKSTDGGQTWGPPLVIPGGDKEWLLIDRTASVGRGNQYIIWQVAYGPNTFLRSTNGGLSFTGPTAVPSTPTFGTLAVDNNGDVYAFGLVAQNFSSFVMARSTTAKNAAQTPTWTTVPVAMGGRMQINLGPNPAGLLGQAQVAVDPTRPGTIYGLCSVGLTGGDPCNVHLVRSTNSAASFSAPVRVNDDTSTTAYQWMGTLGVAPNGRIDVVWNDTRATGVATRSETWYAYSLNGGVSFSRNLPVSPAWTSTVGWPAQNKIGDYYQIVSTGDAAHLAYAATHNNEQDVYYLKLGDCNGNGVHDGVDLQNGTAFDSNQNGVLDECESCQSNLGFGNGLTLSLCGDPLNTAGSRATLVAAGAPPGFPMLLVVSPTRFVTPIPLPGGNLLLPDVSDPGALVIGGLTTDSLGRFVTPLQGGANAVATLYLQAASFDLGFNLHLSNALQVQLGAP